ncbi:hypothetical protein HY480_03320 [Candidatus Uhrbacteria bacterium]|nr:hypothetical protein [Candidatus Uhrbacteria bacterium]
MSGLQHDEHRIATYRKEWGPLDCVHCAGDNSAVAFRSRVGTLAFRDIFRERVYEHARLPQVALSPDGTRFAVAVPRDGNGHDDLLHAPSDILVNGEQRFSAPHGVRHLWWLDNDTLVWRGWVGSRIGTEGWRNGRIAYFRNGEDVTNRFAYDTAWGTQYRDGVELHALDFTDEKWWTVDDRGIAYESGVLDPAARDAAPSDWDQYRRPHTPHSDGGIWRHTREADGSRHYSYDGGAHGPTISTEDGHRVSFGGIQGPRFDAIEVENGMPEFAFSDDRSRVAYVGVRYHPVAAALYGVSLAPMKLYDYLGRTRPVRWLRWGVVSFAWIGALLASPDFGPLDMLVRRSRRYFPATGDRHWRKGYRYADPQKLFFTPQGKLVAAVTDGRGQRVVIDEEEGPAFTAVHHVRYLPEDNAISYVGQRNNDFLRVIVR